MNLCSLGSQYYYYDGLRSYMKDNEFSDGSVTTVCSISFGYALVSGSLASFVLLKKFRSFGPRSRINSVENKSI